MYVQSEGSETFDGVIQMIIDTYVQLSFNVWRIYQLIRDTLSYSDFKKWKAMSKGNIKLQNPRNLFWPVICCLHRKCLELQKFWLDITVKDRHREIPFVLSKVGNQHGNLFEMAIRVVSILDAWIRFWVHSKLYSNVDYSKFDVYCLLFPSHCVDIGKNIIVSHNCRHTSCHQSENKSINI